LLLFVHKKKDLRIFFFEKKKQKTFVNMFFTFPPPVSWVSLYAVWYKTPQFEIDLIRERLKRLKEMLG